MAAEDDPTSFHTTQEELRRQAEAAFGGGGESAPPVGVPGSETTQPSGIPGAGPDRGRMIRRLVVATMGLVVVVAVGAGIYALVGSVSSEVKTSTSGPDVSIPSLPGVPTPPKPESPATPEEPSAPSDLFATAGLRAAKAKAQDLAGAGSRIQLARVTSDQLQVIARDGTRGKVVIISPALTRRIDTPAGSLTGNEFGWASFNPAVAGRLVRAIGRRYDIAASDIDYMVVLRDPIDKRVEWLVYPRGGGRHFSANARGGALRRVG